MKPLTLRAKDGHIGVVSLALRNDLSPKEWEAVGQQLGAISRGHQWWVGDGMRFEVSKYGEAYKRAAEITGFEALGRGDVEAVPGILRRLMGEGEEG